MAEDQNHESDTGVVCRLAHEHLGDGPCGRNAVLNRLPKELRGDEAAQGTQGIATNLDIAPAWKSDSSGFAFVYQKLVTYQRLKEHHKPPGRLERFRLDSFHAKRIVCELLKDWVVSCKDKEEESMDEDEVECYLQFVVALIHFHDRWNSSMFGSWASDNFCETLVQVHGKIMELKGLAGSSEKQYVRVLERLFEKSVDYCDHALRLTLLAVSDNHAELEGFFQRNGQITMKQLAKKGARQGSMFWASDYGQVVHSAMVRGDRQRAPAVGCVASALARASGEPTSAESSDGNTQGTMASVPPCWIMWTHEGEIFKVYEFASAGEAEHNFTSSGHCAVLLSPDGKLKQKAWTSNALLSAVVQGDVVMQLLQSRAEQFIALQFAACDMQPPPKQPVAKEPMGLPQQLISGLSASADSGQGGQQAPAAAAAASAAATAASSLFQGRAAFGAFAARGFGALAEQVNAAADNLQGQDLAQPAGILRSTLGAALQAGATGGRADSKGQSASASGRRPGVHDKVRIIAECDEGERSGPNRGTVGKVGVITEDDRSEKPYNVDFGDDIDRWYKIAWVQLPESEAPSEGGSPSSASPTSPATVQKPPPPATERPIAAEPPTQGSPRAEAAPSETQPPSGPEASGPPAALGPASGSSACEPVAVDRPMHSWTETLEHVDSRWRSGDLETTGLAEMFREPRQVAWRESGVRKTRYMSELFLDVPKRFAALLDTHAQVMGTVNKIIGRGGSKEGLAAIFALRQKAAISGQLCQSMDEFAAAIALMNGIRENLLFKTISANQRLPDQLPAMQRMYLHSLSQCKKLRDGILTEWHGLSLRINDAQLAEEFQRVDAASRDAYTQLMKGGGIGLAALGDSTDGAGPGGARLQLANAPASAEDSAQEAEEVD